MAIETIGATLDTTSADVQRSALQQEDFLKILLTQLSFQDPLEPLDNQEYIAQLAQFTSLEQTQQVNNKIESLLIQQSSTQAVTLIGKTVDVNTESGSQTGDVTAVNFSNGVPLLTVQLPDSTFLTNISLSAISLVK